MKRSISALVALFVTGCPVPEPPPSNPVPIGTIVGRVLVEDPELRSVDGAVVEIYGSSERITTEADKNFVLGVVPLGTHTLIITHPDLDRAAQVEATLSAPFETLILDESDTTIGRAGILRGTIAGGDINTVVTLVGGNANQRADVGDDGSFVLTGLPTGNLQFAAHKDGNDPLLFDASIDEGDNDAPGDLALAGNGGNGITVSGRVQLLQEVEHEGV